MGTGLMKLSVAMITYNHERYIAQAIESALAQRVNFDYEIIIGEDCSTDGTRAVVLDFHRRYPDRIKLLLRERNVGARVNAESTIAACQGEYLAVLEGDDYWTSTDKLQKQVDFLDAHPDRVICCHRVQFLDETGSAEFDVFPTQPAGTYTIEDLLKANFVVTCSAVARRHLIRPLVPSLSRATKAGDWPRTVLAARYGAIELMDDVMAAYRVHHGSMWSSLPLSVRMQDGVRMLTALDRYLEFRYTNTIRQINAESCLYLASRARSEGKRIETARHLVTCIRNGGWQPGWRRLLAGLAAYAFIGNWYKVFSRAKSAKAAEPS
jgi:glycosyltransferase involved in cell wall biosynthesis